MYDPYITALNSQKAALAWFDATARNLGNLYTPGYKEERIGFSDFMNGVQLKELERNEGQGKSHPGKGPTNLMVEGDGYFVIRKDDGTLRYTRVGDFKFNANGSLENESGDKVQGYLMAEDGTVVDTMGSMPSPAGNNPTQSQGGPGHIPTTEINLWVDPSNGKFFGKYDEYKVRSDGVVVGLKDNGKESVPLYKIALANFRNPMALRMVEDQNFVPSEMSGEPMEGTGEVRSGLVELSNVSVREQVSYIQQAKLQLDISAKLISTNKTLLEEALRLIQ
jgi:flagellar hook protein FlgE